MTNNLSGVEDKKCAGVYFAISGRRKKRSQATPTPTHPHTHTHTPTHPHPHTHIGNVFSRLSPAQLPRGTSPPCLPHNPRKAPEMWARAGLTSSAGSSSQLHGGRNIKKYFVRGCRMPGPEAVFVLWSRWPPLTEAKTRGAHTGPNAQGRTIFF